MLKNHFKSAYRNLQKHKSGGIINILGLSIGMASALLIFMWVQNEMNFDDYHRDEERIFNVTTKLKTAKTKYSHTPLILGELAAEQIPEIEKTARLLIANNATSPSLNINNSYYKEKKLAFVDKDWFNIFNYNFAEGASDGFSKSSSGIILTQSTAKKYFGKKPAVGQVINIDSNIYQVTAVVKDNPVNSSFQFDVFLPLEIYLKDNPTSTPAGFSFIGHTFIKIGRNVSAGIVEQKMTNLLMKQEMIHQFYKDTLHVGLTTLAAMHFDEGIKGIKMLQAGDKTSVYIFSILGFLLLAIACINYVNLTTARASKRSKEVSIKKIIGADRKSLFAQFIIESVVTAIIALIITIVLVRLSLPVFNRFTEKNFPLTFLSPLLWKVAGSTLFITILLTGIYPALLLSSFKPLNMLRGVNILKVKNSSLRKILVTTQFTIAIILIIGTIVTLRQLNYIQNNNEGYNRSQIFSISVPSSWRREHPESHKQSFNAILKNELKRKAYIENVTGANDAIQNLKMSMGGGIDWVGRQANDNRLFTPMSVDADFNKMFRLEVKEGRWFREDNLADQKNFILNETAVSELGLKKPYIGQYFSVFGDTGKIIGVVKDFHFRDYRQKIGVAVIYSKPDHKGTFFVQAKVSDMKQALAAAQLVWKKFFPQEPFDYTFMDEEFAQMYKSDIKTSTLVGIFSGIAIFLCCLGLLGLVSFMAEQKTKEIGIRKVLGASVTSITTLLSKDFIKMVLIAVVIASPIAWWAMNKWLEEFVYRIHISWWMFAAAAVLTLLVALFTISFQAIKAARANPVKSLRTE